VILIGLLAVYYISPGEMVYTRASPTLGINIFALLSVFFLVADIITVVVVPPREGTFLLQAGTWGECFCGCFWHLSSDLLRSVGQVPVMAGYSRSWCQTFYLGAYIFQSLCNTQLF
jgi:hypothetical protein